MPFQDNFETAERLTKMAAVLTGCEAAAVVFNQDGVSRVLCGTGLGAQLLSYPWSYEHAPYDAATEFVCADARALGNVQGVNPFFHGETVACLIRLPVRAAPTYTVALLIFDRAPRSEPNAASLDLLRRVSALLADTLDGALTAMADPAAIVTMPQTLATLVNRVAASADAAVLLDQDLKVVAANAALGRLVECSPAALIGRTHDDIAPQSADVMQPIYRKALADKVSSAGQQVRVVVPTLGGDDRVYTLVVSPVSPLDTTDCFLLVTVEETSGGVLREVALETSVTAASGWPTLEPTAEFLLETLVERRAIRARNGISYITLRSWRAPVRAYQLTALKALKKAPPAHFTDAIAGEMAQCLTELIGVPAFKAIVPMPCGHSKDGPCLSLSIATRLAGKLGLPVVEAFVAQSLPGSSHPKKNASRPPMTLKQSVGVPALLVDDVATSGAHIEDAVKLLKPKCGSVLPIAWVGGDAGGA